MDSSNFLYAKHTVASSTSCTGARQEIRKLDRIAETVYSMRISIRRLLFKTSITRPRKRNAEEIGWPKNTISAESILM